MTSRVVHGGGTNTYTAVSWNCAWLGVSDSFRDQSRYDGQYLVILNN